MELEGRIRTIYVLGGFEKHNKHFISSALPVGSLWWTNYGSPPVLASQLMLLFMCLVMTCDLLLTNSIWHR